MLLAPTLSLSAGSGAAIARPTFSRDFAGEKTLNNGTGPSITFTRASDATYFDADGVLRFAPNNHIRNSQAGGSTNGVIGSGGALPTNWSSASTAAAAYEVIGTGTEAGFSYIDIKISGTNSTGSAANPAIGFEVGNQIVAAQNQAWTSSLYVSLVDGSTSGVASFGVNIVERDSSGGVLANSETTFTPTATLTRFSHTRTMASASTGRVTDRIRLTVNDGQTYDLTLRIAAPQLERGPDATAYNPTTGTAYFGPRFDHSGGSSLGLLIEEARTNLFQRSAELDDAYWTKTRASITANAIAAPDGTTSADLLVEDNTASNSHFAYKSVTHAGANAAVTVSVFAKAKERDRLEITALSGTESPVALSGGRAVFNLANGTVGAFTGVTNGASNATGSASIQAVGNGWYRCSLTITPVGVTAVLTQTYFALHNGTASSYTGDNASGLYLWGAQLEAGAFPTSYIPTTTAAVTRQADSAIVTPISSFYNQAEGTLFAETIVRPRAVNIASITQDATEDNRLTLYTAATRTMRWFVNTAGVTEYNSESSAIEDGAVGKIAGAYKSNDVISATNGVLASGDTSITLPSSLTHLFIGRTATTFPPLNGHIRKVAYYPRRLSNALLQSLTT